MTLETTPLTIAAGAGIVSTALAAGIGISLTFFGTHTILHGGAPTDVMLRQWRFQFGRGRALMPGLGALNGANLALVAYHRWSRGLEWRGFAACSVSTFFIIPFTVAFILGINDKLCAAVEGRTKMSEDTARGLIKSWGDYNIYRAVVPAVGAALAMWNFSIS
ncbi:hypothetical protein F5Y15DRAFT_416972 [Xylariaceae sp. FL0016]|nr:hypothetical protein F5Y15DRAFT_416972 [Xylariaceae sp. FL0016]